MLLTGLEDETVEENLNSEFDEVVEEMAVNLSHATKSISTDDTIALWDQASRQSLEAGEDSDEELLADELSLSFWSGYLL